MGGCQGNVHQTRQTHPTVALPGRGGEVQTLRATTLWAKRFAWANDPLCFWNPRTVSSYGWRFDVLQYHTPGEGDRGTSGILIQLCPAPGFWAVLGADILPFAYCRMVGHCARGVELAVCQTRRPHDLAGCLADPAVLEWTRPGPGTACVQLRRYTSNEPRLEVLPGRGRFGSQAVEQVNLLLFPLILR